MAERYTRLASLPENQYAVGSPILITAGALLKDNQTGKALAQVKFKNISEKQIKAIKISVSAFDVSGKELDGVAEYQYLDLTAARTAEFGHKQAVTLPDAVTRSIEVKCTAVFFADGTVWNAEPNAIWTSLPTQKSVTEQLGNLAAQYQRDTSSKSKFIPLEHKDLWFCSCGTINHSEESECHNCRHSKGALFATLDFDTLQQRDAEYNAAEAEKAEQQAAADAVQRAKTTKFAIIGAAIIAIIASAFLVTTKVIIPNSKYNNAVKLMDAGKYEEAIGAFSLLDGYKDSADKILECKYDHAVALMNAGKYVDAISAFEALDGRKDSSSMIDECNYLAANALVDSGKYGEALVAFKALIGYKDSDVQIDNCYTNILGKEVWNAIKEAKPGDVVKFGSLEQDGNEANGEEPIEWIVLKRDGAKILVIWKYLLARGIFESLGSMYDTASWSTSLLRDWLNNEFYNERFTDVEKSLIPTVSVNADRNPDYNTKTGGSTNDKVFLLSVNEANEYFLSNEARKCKPIWSDEYELWWLRTPGHKEDYAAIVDIDGEIITHGFGADNYLPYVRAAMWIDIDS